MERTYTAKNLIQGALISAIFLVFLNVYVLKQFEFSSTVAVKDSLINLLFWLVGAIIISNTVRYYFPHQNRIVFFAGLIVLATIIWSSGSYFLLQFVHRKTLGYQHFLELSLPIRVAFTLLLFSSIAILFAFLNLLDERYHAERKALEMQQLAKETELNNLQEKLHPHFLFNSLNSINALVGIKPESARKMVLQLSDFLRSTIKRKSNEWISLKEELEYLGLYLEIEKVRFGHRLQTELLIPESIESFQLPSFILLPLMENAIKFGLYDTLEDVIISLHISYEKNMLKIEIKNPYDAATSGRRSGTGYGLKAVNRRLYLLFGRSDLLETNAKNNIFFTTIYIPQKS